MDKNEKLAIARKKLKKFQARNSPHAQSKKGGGGGARSSHQQPTNGSSTTGTPVIVPQSTPPPQPRLSSTEGLREISQEISNLLSDSSLKQSSTPKNPPPQSVVSSSSFSSLPTLAPPTLPSPVAAPIPTPSLGTSATSSTSDFALNNHLNDLPLMFKTGSASSLGSSSQPQSFAGQSLHGGGGGSAIENGQRENGYPLPTPSTLISDGLQRNDSSFLASLGHKAVEEQGLGSAPMLVQNDAYLSVNDRHTLAAVASEGRVSEASTSVDFQIGTPKRPNGSPTAEMEERTSSLHVHDGYLERHRRTDTDRSAPPLSSLSDAERRELEQKVQAHAQTIDILVSEKSKLQTELSRLQTQVQSKTREWEEGQFHIKSTRQNIDELEHSRRLLNEELSHKQKALSQSVGEGSRLRENVEKLRSLLEDQQEENTELISKITAQSAEISSIKNANVELQSKLGMSELLNQQLSGDSVSQATPTRSDPTLEEELTKVRGEVAQLKSRLQQVTSDRDQANSDLSALRDAMIQQQEENASKFAAAQTKLAESSAQVVSLTEALQALDKEKEAVSERVSTEHAQFEHSNKVAMETLQQDREDLQSQLQQRSDENVELSKENSELSERCFELEVELSRLKEQSIDYQSLLTTIAQDKETLSRAMSQNKELKSNMAELQDAFVQLSNQNMELASDLETEKHLLVQLKRKLTAEDQLAPPPFPPAPPASEVSVTESVSGQATPIIVEATPIASVVGVGSDDVDGTSDLVDEVKGQEQARLKEQEEQIESLISERSHLLSQLQSLESEHSHSLEEQHTLQEQFEELSVQHQQLLEEVKEEEERRNEAKKRDQIDFTTIKEDLVDVTLLSKDQLLQLQSNFRALQSRFVSLMSEKVELLERLQEHEHVIVQLSVETETIGEYISLYQTQRESLKAKFLEKDLFIEQLTNEKAVVQGKLHELQVLLRQLLSDRAHFTATNGHTNHPRRPLTLSTSAFPLTPTPPHSPTDIPIHMRPVHSPEVHVRTLRVDEHEISSSFSFTRLAADGEEDKEGEEEGGIEETDFGELDTSLTLDSIRNMEGSSAEEGRIEDDHRDHVTTSATAEQILNLIGQLEMTTSGLNRHVAPCPCCTGELTVV